MQYTNEAIRRVILEKYNIHKFFPEYQDGMTFELSEYARVFLDPEFFRCLGVHEGWKAHAKSFSSIKLAEEGLNIVTHYQYEMHRLIDHLIAGGTTEEYFKNLLK